MRFTFQVIQTYTQQSIPTIMIRTGAAKYYFNVPEAFQRFHTEHKVSITRSNKYFFTQMTSDHINGLFGLLFTLYDKKQAFDVCLYGPPGFSQFIENIKILFGAKILPVSCYDFFNSDSKMLGIKAPIFMEKVLLMPDFHKIYFNMRDFLEKAQKQNHKDVNDAQSLIVQGLFYKDENLEIYPLQLVPDQGSGESKSVLSYICKIAKYKGKVNPQKVDALKVPKNFIANIIQKRELMVHGVLYKASDFQDPDDPAAILIIVDCPGPQYINSLTSDSSLIELFEENIDPEDQTVRSIIHLSSIEAMLDSRYTEFFEKFQKTCHHVFLDDRLKGKQFPRDFVQEKQEKKKSKSQEESKSGEMEIEEQKKSEGPLLRNFKFTNSLHKVFPNHFPELLEGERREAYDLEKMFPKIQSKLILDKLTEYVISPKSEEGFGMVKTSPELVLKEKKQDEEILAKQKMLKKKTKESIKSREEPDNDVLVKFQSCDPEMVFLGTGSMMPSTFRNVSAIYLRFWQQDDIGFLLDCGEGTYFQLLHHYGAEKTREILKNLSVIWISHLHADHHLGTMKILIERERILKEENIQKDPVFLIIPYVCAPFVEKYHAVEKLNYRLIFSQHIEIDRNQLKESPRKQQKMTEDNLSGKGCQEFEYIEDPSEEEHIKSNQTKSFENLVVFENFIKEKLGISKFQTVKAIHCPQAYSIFIEHVDGWKFVYSGDTRPNPNLIRKVGHTTILVHESTFGPDLEKEAMARYHSTETEAIDVGMKMNAWRTILTHFSQRYQKQSNTDNKRNWKQDNSFDEYNKQNTIRTLDHLKTKFSELKDLPQISRCYDCPVEK